MGVCRYGSYFCDIDGQHTYMVHKSATSFMDAPYVPASLVHSDIVVFNAY